MEDKKILLCPYCKRRLIQSWNGMYKCPNHGPVLGPVLDEPQDARKEKKT